MMLFRSEEDLLQWCMGRGMGRGATLTVAQTWALPLAALMPERDAMRFWMPALTLGALWSGLTADVLTFLRPRRA